MEGRVLGLEVFGIADGCPFGIDEAGSSDGRSEGVSEGRVHGDALGTSVGFVDGCADDGSEELDEGLALGCSIGLVVGVSVAGVFVGLTGPDVGSVVGEKEEAALGCVVVGPVEGCADVDTEEKAEGLVDGSAVDGVA